MKSDLGQSNACGTGIYKTIMRLTFELGQIGHGVAGFANLAKQVQAIAPHGGVVGVDLHGLEKRINWLAKGRHRGHGGGKIFGF